MPKLSPTYKMQFKRRHIGKTDYRQRLQLLTARKPRLVVRRTSKYIIVQIIEFNINGDKTILSANSRALKKIGWNFACDNLPAAYLTGLAIGKSAKQKNIEEVTLDAGLYRTTKGNRIFAVVKGAKDAGLKINVAEEILPSDERIRGTHIASYQEKFKDLPTVFEKIKQQIIGE